MRVLVTGGAGYLGSVLVPKLLSRGHDVRVVDVGYFGLDHLRSFGAAVEVIREDLTELVDNPSAAGPLLDGVDAVIHLAAISNDPSAELNPALTQEVNLDTTTRLAEAARDQGLRFVFSSSCSVYGHGDGELGEDAEHHPLTTYAVTKSRAEAALQQLGTDGWRPVVLRNGTLFGYSPRMRFDLVVNIFSLQCALYRSLKVFGAGRQWRPFLHVRDAARALVHFVELPAPAFAVYNVAHENLRVSDIASTFLALFPGTDVQHVDSDEADDDRDYRVDTRRMRESGFQPRVTVEAGAEEMVEAIISGAVADPESAFYRNAKWLSQLSDIGARDHREIAEMMETMARLRGRP